jgi:hypothetical protein
LKSFITRRNPPTETAIPFLFGGKRRKTKPVFFSFLVAGLFSATERCADVASQQVLKERQPSASFVGREW